MKKSIAVLIAVIGLAAFIPQDLDAGIGIKGGYSLSRFAITTSGGIPTISNIPSPVGGVFFSFGLGPVAIQPEILYVRMGTSLVFEGTGPEFRLDYIQVPLLLKLSVIPAGPIRPFICGGGYGSYLLKARGVWFVDGLVVGDPVDMGEDYTKYDYGVIGGVGLTFKLPGISISFEGRYNYGLMNIISDPPVGEALKNRSMMALVGIGF
jgi:hypothetical protein